MIWIGIGIGIVVGVLVGAYILLRLLSKWFGSLHW